MQVRNHWNWIIKCKNSLHVNWFLFKYKSQEHNFYRVGPIFSFSFVVWLTWLTAADLLGCWHFKVTVHPKIMKIRWKLSYPQVIQDEAELFLHRIRFGEIQHYITCSPMDPLQWMGAVRMRVQQLIKMSQWINMNLVHQLTSCEEKSCVFVKKQFIFITCLTNKAASEKVVLSESGVKYAKIK